MRTDDYNGRITDYMKKTSQEPSSTSRAGVKARNQQVERHFYDPVPLRSLYHSRGSMVSFVPASERDPEKKVPR
jgi:hypothetical protein